MSNPFCEKLNCVEHPSKEMIKELKEQSFVPSEVIDKLFSAGSVGGGSSWKRKSKKMRGGELSEFKKDRIVDALLLIGAGGSYWFAVPAIEAWLVSQHILPALCDQNFLQHIGYSAMSMVSGVESCQQRATRYNQIITGTVAMLGIGGASAGVLSPSGIKSNYKKAHAYLKNKLFGSESTPGASGTATEVAPTATASGTVSARRERSPSPAPPGGEEGYEQHQSSSSSRRRRGGKKTRRTHKRSSLKRKHTIHKHKRKTMHKRK